MRLLALLAVALAAAAVVAVAVDPLERLERLEPRRPPAPEREAEPKAEREPRAGRRPARPRVRCPRAVDGCRAVAGRVVLVESVDPDGDGDLHVVVAGGDVTAPGLTAIDVAPELRPRRDPEIGSRVDAAGPVQRGSFGQSQIHALRVRFG